MLTVVAGLPGSGKTYLALVEAMRNPNLLIYDDCLGGISGVVGDLERLARAVRLGRDVMANDALLCLDERRADLDALISPGLGGKGRARWRYFVNSPDECRGNLDRRYRMEKDRQPEVAAERRRAGLRLIEKLSPIYRIPDGAEVLPVVDYRGGPPAGPSNGKPSPSSPNIPR